MTSAAVLETPLTACCCLQVVWLTGASQGLGEELALLFAQHGAKLILSSRKEESLRVSQCWS